MPHMAPESAGEIIRLLRSMRNGDQGASDRLIEVVYGEPRSMVAASMRPERSDHTLQPTALVHEACLKLLGARNLDLRNSAYFFAAASTTMRRVLVAYARETRSDKRAGSRIRIALSRIPGLLARHSHELLALDELLERLSKFDPRQSRIIELRFFGGLTEEEIAHVLGLSSRTVKRDWQVGKAWLFAEMTR